MSRIGWTESKDVKIKKLAKFEKQGNYTIYGDNHPTCEQYSTPSEVTKGAI